MQKAVKSSPLLYVDIIYTFKDNDSWCGDLELKRLGNVFFHPFQTTHVNDCFLLFWSVLEFSLDWALCAAFWGYFGLLHVVGQVFIQEIRL